MPVFTASRLRWTVRIMDTIIENTLGSPFQSPLERTLEGTPKRAFERAFESTPKRTLLDDYCFSVGCFGLPVMEGKV
jgi:hypothetical protein